MNDLMRVVALCAVLLTPLATTAHEPTTPAPIRFGSVAMDVPVEMERRLAPLTEYLSRTLRRPVVLILSPDMPSAIRQVAQGGVDIAYLTPIAYTDSRRQAPTRLIARTVTNGKPDFRLMIVVRKDSAIHRVADLAGKSFAFGDHAALLQRAVVVGAGIPLQKLGEYEFLGHYDNIARGVLSGDFDAGILKDTSAYEWETKGLRILYTSPALPPYNITARAGLEPAVEQALQRALLALDPHRPEDRRVIQALDPAYDGFAPVTDRDYDVVRRLIKPFQN